ncbi:DUF2505 domain-containing protein [Nocardioides alcanivorans]|uniref:DUF2505 domain-containing protein n=1 Tax=Nocardioides alcanivorans TaxID=2897352 RepID=UPI001F2D90A9|nr:DUF2505 domain-containing protein [Nocardioides alcanivorans]
MRFTHSARYDAPVADVLAMLTDAGFREKAARAQGSTHLEVTVDGGSVRIDQEQPNTDIPGFAKAFAGDTTRSVVTEQWDGESAAFGVDTPGKPASIKGTRTLVADGDGTLDTFDCEAKAKIPLIGGKIEKLIAGKFNDGLEAEHAVAAAWLAGER